MRCTRPLPAPPLVLWLLPLLLAIGGVAISGACATPRASPGDGPAAGEDVRLRDFGDPVAGEKPPESPGTGAGPGAPPDEATLARGMRRAIVVGISRYKDGGIPRLEFATADADAVYGFLVDPLGGGYPRGNVKLLLDDEATLARIRSEILAVQEASRPEDTFLFYFAGHGTVSLGEGGKLVDNLLVPHDGVPVLEGGRAVRLDPSTGLSIDDLQKYLQVNRSGNLIVILDACFSGGAGGRTLSPVELDSGQAAASERELEGLTNVRDVKGRAVITATAPNEPAVELKALGHGLFTYYLLQGFDNDADRNELVTVNEVFEHVRTRVRDEARKLGRQQTPQIKTSGVAELRILPSKGLKVGLVVRYGEGPGAVLLTAAPAGTPTAPLTVPAATRYQAEVDAWQTAAPLHVYLLRLVRTPAGASSARLLPDGETDNAFVPRVTVAERSAVFYPSAAETGDAYAALRERERDAVVLFVLAASRKAVDLDALDRAEQRALAAIRDAPPAEIARRAAQALEAEPELRATALRYLLVQHGRGLGAPGRR